MQLINGEAFLIVAIPKSLNFNIIMLVISNRVYLLFLAIDDCKSASGGVVQSYEDLVRNYVVSFGVLFLIQYPCM